MCTQQMIKTIKIRFTLVSKCKMLINEINMLICKI